jgi:hypothetical protein
LEIVQYLASCAANLDAEGAAGSAVNVAMVKKHMAVVEFLLASGARIPPDEPVAPLKSFAVVRQKHLEGESPNKQALRIRPDEAAGDEVEEAEAVEERKPEKARRTAYGLARHSVAAGYLSIPSEVAQLDPTKTVTRSRLSVVDFMKGRSQRGSIGPPETSMKSESARLLTKVTKGVIMSNNMTGRSQRSSIKPPETSTNSGSPRLKKVTKGIMMSNNLGK